MPDTECNFGSRYGVGQNSLLSLLGIPDFRRLWIANGLWWHALWLEYIAVGWLVLDMTNSPWQVAVVTFYRALPLLIFGLVAGFVIDRFGARRVIVSSQLTNLVVTGIITSLLWTGYLAVWHLWVGSFLMGASWALDWPARRALMSDLVGRKRILDAMVLENIPQNLTKVIGPFVGGALIAQFGVLGCYLFLVATGLLGLLAVLSLSRGVQSPVPQKPAVSPWANPLEGLRYVQRNPLIFGVFLITIVMNFLAFPYQTLLPVFARDVLKQGPVGYGILGSVNGLGSVLGLIVVNRAKRFQRSGSIFLGGSLLLALALLAFSGSTWFPLSLFLLFCSGIGQAGFSVMQSTIALTFSSDRMRGQVMGAIVLAIGIGPFGRLQIGALASGLGAPWALAITSTLAIVATGAVAFTRPALRAHDATNQVSSSLQPALSRS